jgi:uncharacterized protein YndB with AHSA1/START domain
LNEPLAFEAIYPHSPERVWQALTDPAALGRWLLPTNFRPRIGFRFRFQGGRTDAVKGEVLEADPPKRLRYTWLDVGDDGTAGSPSVVTWTLEPTPGGTRVKLEHQPGDLVAAAEERPHVLIEASMNWRYAMHGSLPALLRSLETHRPPTPIVYVADEPEAEPKRRAGFRQEPEAAKC